ncbi:DUF4012 domain-containing protein [Microbacterium gilvum]|uniref:DUF4012 domain-containing protein n=1 Tax=Microbacterium gilvum TaxID=1336204 RepID=A0ABP9ABF2_9MICO
MSARRNEPDTDGAPKVKKPLRRRILTRWLPWGLVVFVLVYGVVLAVSALIAKSALEEVIPLASNAQESIGSGDSAAMQTLVDDVADKTGAARASTDHLFWRGVEWLPVVGDDLQAVRLAAAAADDLVRDALAPFATVDVTAIGPKDGAIDLDAVRALAEPMSQAAVATETVQIDLTAIDTSTLLGPVESAVSQLTEAVAGLWPTLNKLDELMPHLPTMLGADGPRNYIVIVQNNAEARSTGGNPASLLMLTADQGRLTITQQASSLNFSNGRDTPITNLNEATEALYTDRVGRYIQDTTMPVDFTQTAHLVRAFWSESLGDPGVGVLSFDPVALSYLLKATGPVDLPGGAKLTADNAVDTLLHDIYVKYPDQTIADLEAQDAYFAAAAGGVFEKLTSGSANIVSLVQALAKASGEGRLLYASSDPLEASVVQDTTFTNPLPTDNSDETALGVFVNDTTEGKLDYYANMSVAASSDVCTADGAPTFTAEATYNYTLQPGEAAGLPYMISTGRYYPKGVKATDLVFYGPVGSTYTSATVDGVEIQPDVGTNDLSRPAVRIRIENDPATSHVVSVTFTGGEDEEYGPLGIVHTPLIDSVPIETSTPGCG